MPEIHIIDYAFAGLLLLGAIRGAVVGMTRQVYSLATLVAAVWVAGRYHAALAAKMVAGGHMSERTAEATAYMALLIGVWLAALILRLVLGMVFTAKFKPAFERTGGAAIGLIITAILASAVLAAAGMTQNETVRQAVTERSWVGRRMAQYVPAIRERLSGRLEVLRAWFPSFGGEPGADVEPDGPVGRKDAAEP